MSIPRIKIGRDQELTIEVRYTSGSGGTTVTLGNQAISEVASNEPAGKQVFVIAESDKPLLKPIELVTVMKDEHPSDQFNKVAFEFDIKDANGTIIHSDSDESQAENEGTDLFRKAGVFI